MRIRTTGKLTRGDVVVGLDDVTLIVHHIEQITARSSRIHWADRGGSPNGRWTMAYHTEEWRYWGRCEDLGVALE